MATFSQFKSKYITEKRKPLRGDSLNRNIVNKYTTNRIKKIEKNLRNVDKKIISDVTTPTDGGKIGQSKIEKELNLNKKGDKLLQDINKRKSADLTRADAINRSMGTSGSTEGSGGASGSNTTVKNNVVKPNTRGSSFKRSNLKYDLIGNKLDGKTGNQVFQQNKISNTTSGKTKVELPKFDNKTVTNKSFIKPKNFSQFRQGTATLNKVKPLTKFAKRLGVAGAIADAGVSGYQSYSDSQKKGDSKLKSLGRSAATVAGGVLGGIGGAALFSPVPIPGARVAGGYAGYQYGKKYATKAFDTLTSRKGRMKFKDFVANR
jgi:hypothetical protein